MGCGTCKEHGQQHVRATDWHVATIPVISSAKMRGSWPFWLAVLACARRLMRAVSTAGRRPRTANSSGVLLAGRVARLTSVAGVSTMPHAMTSNSLRRGVQ